MAYQLRQSYSFLCVRVVVLDVGVRVAQDILANDEPANNVVQDAQAPGDGRRARKRHYDASAVHEEESLEDAPLDACPPAVVTVVPYVSWGVAA